MAIAVDTSRSNATVLAAYVEAHDTTLLHPQATFVDQTSGMRWVGPSAIGGMLEWFYAVAFEAHLEDRRLIVDGDSGVLEATFVGVHRGEFAGVPGTGRAMRIPMVVIYDLSGGLIVGARIYFSVASFLAQAGPAS